MTDHKLSQAELFSSLLLKQHRHERLLDKVEKAAARLERRKARFMALEADIAGLETRLSEPRKRRSGKPAGNDGALKPARLIFNPGSGRDDEDNVARLARVVSSLRTHGVEARVGLKTSGGAARELARRAVEDGDALVVVAGGDGTIADVASQLIGSSTVLGIVPTGTMNNVARSLGIPLGIDDACALIGMGTTRHIDLGRVTSKTYRARHARITAEDPALTNSDTNIPFPQNSPRATAPKATGRIARWRRNSPTCSSVTPSASH